jgi:hypothetical protein
LPGGRLRAVARVSLGDNVQVSVSLRVFLGAEVPDLEAVLATLPSPVVVTVAARSSGSPQPGWTWQAVDVLSPNQSLPMTIELQRHPGLGKEHTAAVREIPPSTDRDRVLVHLSGCIAAVEIKLSMVEDEELLFAIVDRLVAEGHGLVFCDGDPAGYFDDPRAEPFLTVGS